MLWFRAGRVRVVGSTGMCLRVKSWLSIRGLLGSRENVGKHAEITDLRQGLQLFRILSSYLRRGSFRVYYSDESMISSCHG